MIKWHVQRQSLHWNLWIHSNISLSFFLHFPCRCNVLFFYRFFSRLTVMATLCQVSVGVRKGTYSGTYFCLDIKQGLNTVDLRKMRTLISRRQQQIPPSTYSLPLLLVRPFVVHSPPCRPRATKLRAACKIAFVRKRRPLSVRSGRYGPPKGAWMQSACVYVCVRVRFCVRPFER